MWTEILTAVALVLVIEGLLPFASPELYRAAVRAVAESPATQMRLMGLSSMIAGVVLLIFVR